MFDIMLKNFLTNIGFLFVGILVGLLLAGLHNNPQAVLKEQTVVTTTKAQDNDFIASAKGGNASAKTEVLNLFKDNTQQADSIIDTALKDMPDTDYISKIDSLFESTDSTGFVTDQITITSAFISPLPVPDNSMHLLTIKHRSFTKYIETTKIVEYKKSFLEKFEIAPNISAGYGMIHKQFDIYAGIGIKYEFDFTQFF